MSLKSDVTTTFKALASILNVGMDLEEAIPLDFAAATEDCYQLLDGTPVEIGSIIWVQVEDGIWQPGRIDTICDSPYYGETGEMAYVVSLENMPFFAGYLDVEVR